MDSSSAFSSSFVITDEQFNLFHLIDRKLFAILINNLSLDPNQSVRVMGFWLWLEQDYIKDLTIIQKILQLSYQMIKQVAEETLFCMKLIENDTIQHENGGIEFHLLQTLIGKSFSLHQLHANRVTVLRGVSRIINEVCVRAFRDIIEKVMKTHEQNQVHPLGQGFVVAPAPTRATGEPSESIGLGHDDLMRMMGELSDWLSALVTPAGQMGLMQGGEEVRDIPIKPIHVGSTVIRPPLISGPTPFHHGMQFQGPACPVQFGVYMPGLPERQMRMMGNEMLNNPIYGGEYDSEVEPDNRTIFLTFSKGYPISQDEVWHFFTRRFGNFIESIHMQEVQGDEQVLYARMIAKSVAMMEQVVEGRRAKYYINGKHVCARKSVRSQKSTQPKRAGSV